MEEIPSPSVDYGMTMLVTGQPQVASNNDGNKETMSMKSENGDSIVDGKPHTNGKFRKVSNFMHLNRNFVILRFYWFYK